MLRVDSHAWPASSTGAYRNTTEKVDEKVKIVRRRDSHLLRIRKQEIEGGLELMATASCY